MGDSSSSSSSSYIHMVHHLIEECIVFNMNREECMEALSKHANIEPVITSTVWKELEKENKEFFEAYAKIKEERGNKETEIEAKQSKESNMLRDRSTSQRKKKYCNNL